MLASHKPQAHSSVPGFATTSNIVIKTRNMAGILRLQTTEYHNISQIHEKASVGNLCRSSTQNVQEHMDAFLLFKWKLDLIVFI